MTDPFPLRGPLAGGDVVEMVRARSALTIGAKLGEGGQAAVYRARMNGAEFAVKWYRPGHHPGLLQGLQALVDRGRPPHPAFVWPIDLVISRQRAGFGYVMPLLEPRFISFARMLSAAEPPRFRTLVKIGLELVDAFAALHASGLCYRDISFGNLWVDPASGQVAVIDNDNVGPDGGTAFVKGTPRFMAPEVLRDEALPGTVSDLHSLAAFLFYLFMFGHPLEGRAVEAAGAWTGGLDRRPGPAAWTGGRRRRCCLSTSAPRRCSSSTPTTRATGRSPATRRPCGGRSTRGSCAASSPASSPSACGIRR